MALGAKERSHPSLLERPRLFAVRPRAVGDKDQTTADPRTDSVRACGPARQERLRGKRFLVDFLPGYEDKAAEHDRKTEDELRRRLRRQDALVAAIALLLLAVAALAVTCLYWATAGPSNRRTMLSSRGGNFPRSPGLSRHASEPTDLDNENTRCVDNQGGWAAVQPERGAAANIGRSELPGHLAEKIFAPAPPLRAPRRIRPRKIARLCD